ncbi:MAG TPA: putative sulfate exporter family transporter [Streptosporangiales bacterium]
MHLSTRAPASTPAPAPPPPRRPAVLRHAPGLAVVAVGVAVAFAVNRLLPVAGTLTVAVALGVLARNAGLVRPWALPGARFATRRLLRTGVVLLGLQLAVGQVLRLPAGVLLVVLVTVTITFAVTLAAGRLLRVTSGTSLLVATGFSICGASAAAAMDAVSDSDEEDLATAVALVTIFGGAALLLLPLVYGPLGLSPVRAGAWAGASVHEVAQVVAAASPAGATALATAVVVKLTRVVLLAPLVAGRSLVQRARSSAHGDGRRPPLVPLFVLGFLAMIGVRSTGLVPHPVLGGVQVVTTLVLAGALFGLGTGVHLRTLVRTGGRAVALGLVSTLVAAGTSLAAIHLFA